MAKHTDLRACYSVSFVTLQAHLKLRFSGQNTCACVHPVCKSGRKQVHFWHSEAHSFTSLLLVSCVTLQCTAKNRNGRSCLSCTCWEWQDGDGTISACFFIMALQMSFSIHINYISSYTTRLFFSAFQFCFLEDRITTLPISRRYIIMTMADWVLALWSWVWLIPRFRMSTVAFETVPSTIRRPDWLVI